ncbi:cytochrome [Monoraphidium neglectum]|uniref:Cytochrome n=1 Tax=Monoraphidium neglectum TaxID=145388 RepID=A0A0D2K2V9_9CHLO|nr:cytochrome [Monoraphidium neglectum]KIZ04868.1 cytochrome [Monoraphidium neglectum]|eukprot:XP_013903887.1 cytochrome [Monoraphidium neglectum]
MLEAVAVRARRVAAWPNVLHFLLFVLSLSLAFSSYNGTLFGWHPFCMAIGYLFFMGEGLISAWAIRTTAGEERLRGLDMHALMQLRAVVLIAIGAGVIIHNKNLNHKAHFKTLHGKLGLLTLVLTGLSPLLGAISFRKLGLLQRFPEQWHSRLKKAHRVAFATPAWQVGTAAAGGLMVTLLYGRIRRQGVLKGV